MAAAAWAFMYWWVILGTIGAVILGLRDRRELQREQKQKETKP